MTPTEFFISSVKRQKYLDLDEVEISRPAKPDEYIQLKYDGIWCALVADSAPVLAGLDDAKVVAYSRTKQTKATPDFYLPHGTILLCEYMFGQQWSKHPDLIGKFFVFDCVMTKEKDIRDLPYQDRYLQAASIVNQCGSRKLHLIPAIEAKRAKLVVDHLKATHQFEGIVRRSQLDNYFVAIERWKYDIIDDFVVLGFKQGAGRLSNTLGSISVGKFNGVEFVVLMDVSGGLDDSNRDHVWNNKNDYLYSVVSIKGKARFESGAFRHPTIIAFRDDKQPVECLLDE